MKRLSLQWRITLLTILLLAAACVTMKTLLCSSGHAYTHSFRWQGHRSTVVFQAKPSRYSQSKQNTIP